MRGGGWVGGLDTIAMAKGKSAVMNNVCKRQEGGSQGKEMGGGRGKLFTTFLPALPFLQSWPDSDY